MISSKHRLSLLLLAVACTPSASGVGAEPTPSPPAQVVPPVVHPTFDYAPIADQLTRVPDRIAANYRFDLSADRNELTIDPQPRPAIGARSAGARGFTARDSEDGGKILTLAGGPFRDAAWADTTLRALVADPSRQQQLEAAGYALDQPRELLVVTGESDPSPTIFAFSADPNKPGIVGICAELTLIDFRPGVRPPIAVRKPVLYFYPERPTQLHVQVELDGDFIATYPHKPSGGWTVTAHPDGTLHDPGTGRSHRYLFWEGTSAAFELDPARAHLVPGADAAPFLERACADYALRDEECTDLITYWLPALAANPYNLVEFVDEARYGAYARLQIDPAPDALIRLFIIFRASEHPVPVGAPLLAQRRRGRFTAVEWGGAQLDVLGPRSR